ITARLAMEQDREVMAVPGNITSKNSFGTNYLIKSGAKLVQQWQDVVAEFPAEIAAEILPPKVDEKVDKKDKTPKSNLPKGLTVNEKKIYENLKADEHKHIDLLMDESGLSFGEFNQAIVSLDLKDLLLVLPGNNYARKI
ncbi:MAG: DNA-processing protein DprA, partial [Aridibacter sp.]